MREQSKGIGRVLVEANPVRDAFKAAHEITVLRGKTTTSSRYRRLVCSCGRLDKRTVDSNVTMWSSFHRADEWQQWKREHTTCPDGGTCHHFCSASRCWRVEGAGPLTGVFPGDEWPWERHAPILRGDDHTTSSTHPSS